MRQWLMLTVLCGGWCVAGGAWAQSSSLYVQDPQGVRADYQAQQMHLHGPVSAGGAQAGPGANPHAGAMNGMGGPAGGAVVEEDRGAGRQLDAGIAAVSFTAVRVPEPRVFAVHDLVTIIIRESMESDFRAMLETDRSVNFDGNVANLPFLDDENLQDFHPRLGLDYGARFDSEGDYRRRESITGRVQAQIIDVKPNGNLVLEARKHLSSDGEQMTLVLTGTARVADVTGDNTVLSSELYDLRLVKESDGELRRTTRKGIITRVLETIFAF